MPQVTARFREWAPRMMRDLIADFGFTDFQAAGIVGNGGQESGGFETMQELRPTVKGSRGGLGAFQWTGPRRLEFEKWLARNKDKGWTAHNYEATYSFLFRELIGPERPTIAAVKAAKTVGAATEAFCKVFERPGIYHMQDRVWWAKQALALYRANPLPAPMPAPVPVPEAPVPTLTPKPWYLSKTVIGAIIAVVSPLLAKAIPSLAGIDPNAATETVLNLIEVLGPLFGGGLALVGRISATAPIAGTQAQAKVENVIEQATLAPSPIQRAETMQAAAPSLLQLPLDRLAMELPELLQVLGSIQQVTRQIELPSRQQ